MTTADFCGNQGWKQLGISSCVIELNLELKLEVLGFSVLNL